MLVVALTGGIGSGKSTVSDRLAALGVPVIDADLLARKLTEPGNATLDRITQAFGSGILNQDGSLDRAALRRIAFADEAARRRLEEILHPRIRALMEQRLSQLDTPYALLVIPLLFETGQTDLADRILVVDVPEEVQIRRVQQRSGLELAEIRRILASQSERSVRRQRADDLIDNSGDRESLDARVDELHRRYLDLAAQKE